MISPHHHGSDLGPSVALCDLCGERPYRYPGRRCFACWRATSGFVPMRREDTPARVVEAVEDAPARPSVRPPPPPRPRAPLAARTPQARRKPPRLCSWPGCERHHATKGACRMHFRRLQGMSAVGSAPETWPSMWETYQAELDELAIWNGALHKGVARGDATAALTLAQFRALRGRP